MNVDSIKLALLAVGPGPIITGAQALNSIAIDNSNEAEKPVLIGQNNMRDLNDINHSDTDIASLKFKKAIERSDIKTISRLAEEIWRKHYNPIIGDEQVEYMLADVQNLHTIRHRINSGYHYFLLSDSTRPLAYFLPNKDRKSLHLHKLYVRAGDRRLGVGSRIIVFTEAYCRNHGFAHIRLTVNRNNRGAIDFYLRNKFINAGIYTQETDLIF